MPDIVGVYQHPIGGDVVGESGSVNDPARISEGKGLSAEGVEPLPVSIQQ